MRKLAGGLAGVCLLTGGGLTPLGRAAELLPSQLLTRALTHQDIADYALPEDTQASGGLHTVGVGQPAYLEVLVDLTVPGADISEITWALTAQPDGATAALAPSPLGPEVPMFQPSDRLVYQVAGRKVLIPDVAGQYTVSATFSIEGVEAPVVLTLALTAATYEGYQTCALCHSGGLMDDKVTPWSGTGHASMFTEAIDGLKSSHYNEGCIECHTVGYDPAPGADNGGFDDLAAQVGWTFPEELKAGNWDAMDPTLQGVANIQCENCHGPGGEHARSLGNPDLISVSMDSGDCAQCHSEEPYHIKPIEWANSQHAVTTRYPTGPGRESCVGCHSGIGFLDRLDGLPVEERDPTYAPITCATCHDPHDATNPHQLRTTADVTLMDVSAPGGATVITAGGNGKLCMNCHMSRRDAVTYVESYHSHYGPHRGPQADMLAGANAITYGEPIPSSGHLVAVEDTCATCHMQATGKDDPAHFEAGGHTFKPSWDGGTPDDPSDDEDLVGACMGCHGPITSFDFARSDYNGDGIIEGVQTEVTKLMDELAMMLPPMGEPTVKVTEDYAPEQLKAAYNYLFVLEDGSKGIHNVSYAVGLLKASIGNLTNDADQDGLDDTWEITYFGSITAYDGTGDPDKDLARNALEIAAGTNPTLADTDKDNFDDYAELLAGSDPTNPDDVPGFILKIYTAAELEFASEAGKTYQIQAVSEVTGQWQVVEDNIAGTGGMISRVTSTRTETPRFYRVMEVQP